MKTSIWYNVEEILPEKAGTYITFVGPTLADSGGMSTSYFTGGLYWRERIATHSPRANVVYWCDADPWNWYDNPRLKPVTAMEKAAWARVEDAISKYEMIRALSHA